MCREVFFTSLKCSNLLPAMWLLLKRAFQLHAVEFRGDIERHLKSLWTRTHLWNWAKNWG